MAVISACPNDSVLQQLALGKMPPEEVDHLGRHCEQCPNCIRRLQALKTDDTLIEALASQSTESNPIVDALIERLKRTPPPTPESEMTATIAGGDTPSGEAVGGDFVEKTQAGEPSLAPPQSTDEIGRLGGYRVLKMLGAGGMGMVYQAEDMHLQRPIALKVMKAELSKNPGNRERFLREARAAAKLKSDHVVTIHQVSEERQIVFLAMEYLEGMSLDDWLKMGRKPTMAQAARIGRQIALGLADAHACGLIHRDIKPANIWLDSRHQGRVKLLDFGLARGDKEDVQLTQSGAIVGTPAYMAPEQARGEKVDHRVDLFSLGVVLYRLTTGRLPFQGDNTMSLLTSLALDHPKPPRDINADISPRMATLIERLLTKDREQRPATAKAVADELALIEREATQPAADDRTVLANRQRQLPGKASTRQLTLPVRRIVIAASLLLLLGGLAAGIVVIVRDKDGNKVAEVNVPEGGSAEIKDDGKIEANRQRKLPGDKIVVPPLVPLLPGTPLSPVALVQRPAKLPGVRSWSIESRNIFYPEAMAYSPDGKRLAVACVGGVFRIWEPESGRLVQMILESHSVHAMAWSPDGRTLALGCRGKRPVRLFDAETGRFLRGLEAPAPGEGSALAWTDDGRKVRARMHSSTDCYTWNVADGKLLDTVQIPCVNHAFSPNGKQLAGHRADGRLAVWDAATGKEVRLLGAQASSPNSLAWSPKGDRVASTDAKGLHVWNVESGKESFTHPEPRSATWSPDGQRVVYNLGNYVGGAIINLEAGAKPERLEGFDEGILAWSPDGKSIAGLSSRPNDLHLYDAVSGKRLRSLSEGVSSDMQLAFSPAGRMIALSEPAGQTTLSSVDSGHTVAVLKDTYGPLAWSPDGKTLAKNGPNHSVILWDDAVKTRIILKGHQGEVLLLAWSPDGKRLISYADGEKRMLLWDAEKGDLLREMGPIPTADGNSRMTWSADGRLLAFRASVEKEQGWHIWDVEQNKLVNHPKEWKETFLIFSPDSRSALVGSYGVAYRLRDCTTGKEVRSLPLTGSSWGSMPAWSPDGRLLAVPSLNWGVELWRGDLSRRVRTLPLAYPDLQQQIAFSPDGKWTFGRAGERLHVWETNTGRLRGILLLGEKNNGLTISADGHYTGNDQVERGIVVVVQKDDGTQELLEPADFEQKYGWKNQPDKVHLLQPLPPPLYPQPGMPMGEQALVREPAELPDANSWTIETVNPRGQVKAVAYRPDGKQLATGGDDGVIRIWDPADGKLIRMLVGDPVGSLSWSKDGKVLTAGDPKAGREWDVDTGRLLRHGSGIANPATKEVHSPDGKQTAKIEPTGVHVYDSSGKRLHTLEEGIGNRSNYRNKLTWSPDGRSISLGFPPLRLVEAATGRGQGKLQEAHHLAAWSPDGRILAAKGTDNSLRLWDAIGLRPLREMDFAGHTSSLPLAMMQWSPDGKMLAAGGEGHLYVWSTQTGKPLLWKDVGSFGDLAWSPDGRQLAFGAFGGDAVHLKGTVYVWQADSGKLLFEEPLPTHRLAWSPDGKKLAISTAGERDGWGNAAVALIDAASGKLVHKGPGIGLAASLHWSSDGKTFASLRMPRFGGPRMCVWDGMRCSLLRNTPLQGIPDTERVAWSPDGRVLAWAGDSQVHLLDNEAQPLGLLLPFESFGQLAITADGRYRGNARVERLIRMVVQKADGTTETLTPNEFEQKYSFKNEPDRVRLLDK